MNLPHNEKSFNVAFIPARGGSKGIPKKNLIQINNKPLIQYTIEAALKSNVNEVWVSSDDNDILEISNNIGAKTILRPDNISLDNSSSELALLHFANKIKFNKMIFLQATCPLTIPEDINQCLEKLNNYESVITVSETTQNIWFGNSPQYDLKNRKRRQEKKKIFIETGAIFGTYRDHLIKNKNRISGNIGFVEVPKKRSIDIDDYEDLYIVNKLLK